MTLTSIPLTIEGYGGVVLAECKRLTSLIRPISDRHHGPLNRAAADNTLFPFVLLLGNHSSGKSSFINYVLGRKVQTTGVAPTDDNFTIIGPGDEDIDRNGPALVGDPDLGFGELKGFGSTLINHTQLKVRAGTAVKDFMIVDSPGMIDSPAAKGTAVTAAMDRGYHFDAVCRWYAERADVILLFFDPDKPGTTGETLSILTNSLVGVDHKLYIILNKADQFCRIHDFARAYGSLCWNLSKVIPRKDLPRIHTMCVPVNQENNSLFIGQQAVMDLEEARSDVLREVFNAPRRRVDNEISRLYEQVSALIVHCKVLDSVVGLYRAGLWRCRIRAAGSVLGAMAISIGAGYLQTALSSDSRPSAKPSSSSSGAWTDVLVSSLHRHALLLSSTAVSSLLAAGTVWWEHRRLDALLQSFSARSAYEQVFQEVFAKEVAAQDEFVISVGSTVLDHLPINVPPEVIPSLSRIPAADVQALERIRSDDIANLRRRASPSFPVISPMTKLPPAPRAASPATSRSSRSRSGSVDGEPRDRDMDLEVTMMPDEEYNI